MKSFAEFINESLESDIRDLLATGGVRRTEMPAWPTTPWNWMTQEPGLWIAVSIEFENLDAATYQFQKRDDCDEWDYDVISDARGSFNITRTAMAVLRNFLQEIQPEAVEINMLNAGLPPQVISSMPNYNAVSDGGNVIRFELDLGMNDPYQSRNPELL